MGYGFDDKLAGQVMGQSGDGGVDGVIRQDKLGLENIYLQAKRWESGSVGRPQIQAFVGALSGHRASKGVFITTAQFTKEAREFADTNPTFKISLIDGYELVRLMIEHNLGVSVTNRYEIKRIDSDFFIEE
jgi:restriction system protein